MAKNFLELITLLVTELEKPGMRGFLGRAAFTSMAETGDVTSDRMAEVHTTGEQYKQWGMADLLEPGAAVSCGLTANAFCYIFAGAPEFANSCSDLGALKRLVADGRQRAIRITMRGHTFVIEQVQTAGSGAPKGNIYQSNVAVINNTGHLGITIQKYMKENPNPVDLNGYIGKLGGLTSATLPSWTQLSIYKDLFTVKSYRNNPNVHRITSDELMSERAGLSITRITWQYFNEYDVLNNLLKIFQAPQYNNVMAATKARLLFASA